MKRYTNRGRRTADKGGEFDGGFGEIGIDEGLLPLENQIHYEN